MHAGDRIRVGQAEFEIRATLSSEPDKLASGIGFGPRLLISEDALRATGLVQPGSLVRWVYRVRLPGNDSNDAAVKALIDQAHQQLPNAGWEVRNRSNVSPQLERLIEQFTQYLTLVGLTALLVGGVGIANVDQILSRAQARRDRHAEIRRRYRHARGCDLSGRSPAARHRRRADRLDHRRGVAVCNRRAPSVP